MCIFKYFCLLVGCFNPNSTLSQYNMLFGPSQSLIFPANNSQLFIIICKLSYMWQDGSTVKNLTCLSDHWSLLPPACIRMFLFLNRKVSSDVRFLPPRLLAPPPYEPFPIKKFGSALQNKYTKKYSQYLQKLPDVALKSFSNKIFFILLIL